MATASSQSYYNEVQSIFIELFDRPAGVAGYDYFGSELATGANPATVFGQIAGSTEVSSSLTVTDLFENLLGRAPAAAGLSFFNGELASGMTIAQVASQIYFDVLSEPHTSEDYMVMTDKIDYANNYTGYLSANPSFTYNTADAQAYVNQVTPAGVMTGTITTPPTSSSMPPVNSFLSGTTVDLVTTQSSYIEPSTAGVVDFVYGSGATNAQTGSADLAYLKADTLQAGAGGATLTINSPGAALGTFSGTVYTSDLPAVSGVSTIVINHEYSGDNLNISGIAGVSSLIIDDFVSGSTDSYTINTAQTLTLENIPGHGTLVNANSTGTFADVTLNNDGTSAASPMTLGVNTASPNTYTSMAALNLTLQGTNYISPVDATGNTLAALNITDTNASDSAFINGTNLSYVDSVNASNDAAALTYIMPTTNTTSTDSFIFKGGMGTDTIQLTAAPQAGVSYSFDGNSAGTNTLDINYLNATQAELNIYTYDAPNFNTLAFSAPDSNIINLAGINPAFDNINFGTSALGHYSANGDYSFTNAAANDVFTINTISNSMARSTLTIADAPGVNTTHLVMDSGSVGWANLGTINTNSTDLSITMNLNGSYGNWIYNLGMSGGLGYQSTVDITSNGGNGTFSAPWNDVSSLSVADGGSVTATGAGALVINNLYDATAPSTNPLGVTFNASGLSGDLHLYDNINNTNPTPDHIIFGSGADTAYFGNGNYTVTFGSGTDTAYFGYSNNTWTHDFTGSNTVTLGSGSDTVGFGDAYTQTNNQTQTLTLGSGTAAILDNAMAVQTYSLTPSGTFQMNDYINITNGTAITTTDSITFLPTAATPQTPDTTVLDKNSLINSGITNAADAISTVIHALQADNPNNGGYFDAAGWFQYGGNTYIVNDYYNPNNPLHYYDEVVQLTGTVAIPTTSTLSGTTVSHL